MKVLLIIGVVILIALAVIPAYKPRKDLAYAKAVLVISACFASYVIGLI